jgi:sulfur-carrier protein
MIRLLYFAWVRERMGQEGESLELPADVASVGALLDHLAARGGGSADALADRDAIRVAVNQAHVDASFPVRVGDEVAIFPPVTGG